MRAATIDDLVEYIEQLEVERKMLSKQLDIAIEALDLIVQNDLASPHEISQELLRRNAAEALNNINNVSRAVFIEDEVLKCFKF